MPKALLISLIVIVAAFVPILHFSCYNFVVERLKTRFNSIPSQWKLLIFAFSPYIICNMIIYHWVILALDKVFEVIDVKSKPIISNPT